MASMGKLTWSYGAISLASRKAECVGSGEFGWRIRCRVAGFVLRAKPCDWLS